MPTIEESVNVSIEFEVFCGTCNAGLCGQSDTRRSRTRGELQVTVEACQDCIDRETAPLNGEIEDLTNQVGKLQAELAELKSQLDNQE